MGPQIWVPFGLGPIRIGVLGMGCSYCGNDHHERYVCNAKYMANGNGVVANANKPMANETLRSETVAEVRAASTYRYRDAEKRKAYQRELMRKRRAGG